jgi:hypothetical protein
MVATGNHVSGGAQVWRIRDATKVKDLPIDGGTSVIFSPDGKWLMTGGGRLWEVGTWREAWQIKGGWGFSPDSRLAVVYRVSRLSLRNRLARRTLHHEVGIH